MDTKCININAGVNKVMPVSVILLCWLIFSSGFGLRAQESVDLPSKPEATAATIPQDNSAFSGSTNTVSSDAPVISRNHCLSVTASKFTSDLLSSPRLWSVLR
jgi:hypothetical protein